MKNGNLREGSGIEPEVIKKIKEETLSGIDYSAEINDEMIYERIEEQITKQAALRYISVNDRLELKERVFSEIRGFGSLDKLLSKPEITEIMINGYKDIFVEEAGHLYKTEYSFDSPEELNDLVQRMVSEANKVVSEAEPIADSRLKDGSRVNIVLPPVALNGPIITIRKFSNRSYSLDDLVRMRALTEEVATELRKMVLERKNIFISGGTGSGKTTFLNALSGEIPKDERIITIEDSAELKLIDVPNLVRLEARSRFADNVKEVSIRDLIKTSLRARPDRIVVGEVRGAEAIDMVSSMNTGHSGSLSTGHANSAQDMLSRLETMILLGIDIPLLAVRKQIASALDVIVHLGRVKDGKRRVLEVTLVGGVRNNEIKLNPLFRYDENADELKRV